MIYNYDKSEEAQTATKTKSKTEKPEQASKPFHEKLLESEKIVCLITGKTYETKGLIAFKHFNEWYFRTQDGEEIQAKHLRSPKDVEKFKSERWRQNKPAFGK